MSVEFLCRHNGGYTTHIANAEQPQSEQWAPTDLLIIFPLLAIGVADFEASAVTTAPDNRQWANIRSEQQVKYILFGTFFVSTLIIVYLAAAWYGLTSAAKDKVAVSPRGH